MAAGALKKYNSMRDFTETSEPKGVLDDSGKRRFVVQEHHATRLHFDFRMEIGGVLVSWAVPKGPSLNPADKRLAMQTEDHPVAYLTFKGAIPEGNYGAGEMRIWDKGTYKLVGEGTPESQLKAEKLMFVLKGKKLKGEFHLFKFKGRREENAWLMIKIDDAFADPDWQLDQLLNYGAKKERNASRKASTSAVGLKEKLAAKRRSKTPAASTRKKVKTRPKATSRAKRT
jgi:bifunctional non-homologous end joining protein LigD